VNSEEFPRRTSYESYSHMSIVAQKIDELPKPIFLPRLEFLMLKLFEEPLKLQDDIFVGMSKLNVLSLSGYEGCVLPFPKSVQLLSNLRTLSLINLRLDDISIIGELVTLEILTIRDSTLEVLLVEIGKLTNLILLEFWNERVPLENISPGVLSRLVRLEELTLVECSGDVIHSNLDLSSKLTRYYLNMGQQVRSYHDSSLMDNYNRTMVLDIIETTPLGDWFCRMLKKSELVHSRGNGSKNVLTELLLGGFQNVKHLSLAGCDSLTHLLKIHGHNNIPFPKLQRLEVHFCVSLQYLFSGGMVQVIKFPYLYELHLEALYFLTHFFSDNVEGIEFPLLRKMRFNVL